MNEYSFLQGVIDSGREVYAYCKNKGFEEIYNKLNFFEHFFADTYMKSSLEELLKSVAGTLSPGSKVNVLLKSKGFTGDVRACLKNKNCIELVNEVTGVMERLQKSYTESLNNEDYTSGVKLLINVLDTMYNNVPQELKAVVNWEISRKIDSLKNSGRDVTQIDKSIDDTVKGCIDLLNKKLH